ncbi:MAG: hypothetical protein LBT33_08205 [Spirochaetia bacterium]|jgi:hypothetical protein|nr:hypothetical protein [Spirochaetia bacterium]
MEIIDDVDGNEKGREAMPEAETDGLFYALLNGKAITETVSTSRGDFTVRFPKQRDVLAINTKAAFLHAGLPVGCYDQAAEYEIQKVATLDVLVTGGPKWYEGCKAKNKDFSWRDAPDVRFTDELFTKALTFRQEVQERLGQPEEKAGGKNGQQGVQAPVGDGLFEGAAIPPKRG